MASPKSDNLQIGLLVVRSRRMLGLLRSKWTTLFECKNDISPAICDATAKTLSHDSSHWSLLLTALEREPCGTNSMAMPGRPPGWSDSMNLKETMLGWCNWESIVAP